jgi:hypothetical protein
MTQLEIKTALDAAMEAAGINIYADPVISVNLSGVCDIHGRNCSLGDLIGSSIGIFRSTDIDQVSEAIAITQGEGSWAEGTVSVICDHKGMVKVAQITRQRVGDFFAPAIVAEMV